MEGNIDFDYKSITDRNAFSTLLHRAPATINQQHVPEKKWDGDVIANLSCYTIHEYDDATISGLGIGLFESITTKTFDSKDAYRILILACHVYELPRGNGSRVLRGIFPTGESDLNKVFNNRLVRTRYSSPISDTDDLDTIRSVGRITDVKFTEREGTLKYVTFLAAFLLRFIVKEAPNIRASWSSFTERFHNFYGTVPHDGIDSLDEDWIKTLKTYLGYDKLIVNTWVKAVVSAEDYLIQSEQSMGIIRFVAVIPLSCSGMHAYKLFTSLLGLSKQKPGWLLDEMMAPQNRDALGCIAQIMYKWESTPSLTRSQGFKYARIISPEYFQDVQTRQCPQLVYLLACLVKKYKGSTDAASDPTSIKSLEDISPEIKRVIHKAANNIFVKMPKAESSWFSESFIAAYDDSNQGPILEKEGQDDEQEVDYRYVNPDNLEIFS